MLPPKIQLPPDQQRLLKLYRQLSPGDREGLLSYAEFLQQRAAGGDGHGVALEEQLPADIPRPDSETVVAAMRRLSRTFYMIDKGELLHEASELMTAHLMQGRPAAEVIDELEVVFRRHYRAVGSRPDADER
jgi:hypothetical protein